MTWLLTQGDYSAYSVVGVLPDEETARRLIAELETLDEAGVRHEYQVEERDMLADPHVRVEDHCLYYIEVAFDGETRGDRQHFDEQEYQQVEIEDPPTEPACDVYVSAAELFVRESNQYKLGVRLQIMGAIDIERCRKVWSEQRAQVLADALPLTVREWSERLSRDTGDFWAKDLACPVNDPVRAQILAAVEARRSETAR